MKRLFFLGLTLLVSSPAEAYTARSVGGWYVGSLGSSACLASNIQNADYVSISYDGSDGVVTVTIGSQRYVRIPEFDNEGGSISFSPSLLRYHGKMKLYHVSGREDQGFMEIKSDNPLILSDFAREKYVRLVNDDGLLNAQAHLSGSAKAVDAIKDCVEQEMSGGY